MLVLTRAEGETVVIDGGRIVITVVDVRGKSRRVRLGIEADKAISVDRGEVAERKKKEPAR